MITKNIPEQVLPPLPAGFRFKRCRIDLLRYDDSVQVTQFVSSHGTGLHVSVADLLVKRWVVVE